MPKIILVPFGGLKAHGINYCADHLRRKCAAGEFPKPVILSRDRNGRVVRKAWVLEEIEVFKRKLLEARDAG